jgi:hypothetical protein
MDIFMLFNRRVIADRKGIASARAVAAGCLILGIFRRHVIARDPIGCICLRRSQQCAPWKMPAPTVLTAGKNIDADRQSGITDQKDIS